jgi:hypothetical protein
MNARPRRGVDRRSWKIISLVVGVLALLVRAILDSLATEPGRSSVAPEGGTSVTARAGLGAHVAARRDYTFCETENGERLVAGGVLE